MPLSYILTAILASVVSGIRYEGRRPPSDLTRFMFGALVAVFIFAMLWR